MGQKLPPIEKELYRRCDEVLHYIWDPIGVAGSPAARDEYDSYVWPVFGLVNQDAPVSKIADTLNGFVSERMELAPDKAKAREVARLLLEWRDRINENFARDLVSDRPLFDLERVHFDFDRIDCFNCQNLAFPIRVFNSMCEHKS